MGGRSESKRLLLFCVFLFIFATNHLSCQREGVHESPEYKQSTLKRVKEFDYVSVTSTIPRVGQRIHIVVHKALRSAGGFRRPLRSLTRKIIEQNANEPTHRSTILGAS